MFTTIRFRRIVCFLLAMATVMTVLMIFSFSRLTKETMPSEPSKSERDYVIFQELIDQKEKEEASVLKPWDLQTQNKLNLYKGTFVQSKNYTESCVTLRTSQGDTPICVYRRETDSMISSHVRDHGTWEEDLLNATGSVMATHPNMEFLDLGCNIGVYTLFIASMKRNVLSVDPVIMNLDLLYLSLNLGKLSKYVTLVQNCVSDIYETVSMNIPSGNIGGAHVTGPRSNDGDINVETILLDDLIPLLEGKELFIKMDIEGYELRALMGAHTFFQTVSVKYILMEWVHHRHNNNGQYIIDFLVKNGFLPYEDAQGRGFLDPDKYYTWPENVFWIKR